MANSAISGLTASAANAAATDVLPVVQTTGVGPVKMTIQQVIAGILGSSTIRGATVTTSQPLLDLSQTWNASGVTFTGMRFNVPTDSSAAGSLLMDLQVGGGSQFRARKDGYFSTNLSIGSINFEAFTTGGGALGRSGDRTAVLQGLAQGGLSLPNNGSVSWASGTTALVSAVGDLILTRRGAANLRLGAADAAAPVAQTLSVQSVVAGTSNTAGANLTITGAQGTGTGAGGSIVFQVAPAGGAGSTPNALQNVFLLPGVAGEARIINASGGSGNLTIASTANTNASITFRFSADTLGSGGSVAGFAGRISGNFGFFDSSGTNLIVGQPSGSTDSISIWGTDVRLARDAADTLALRRSTNAQTFRVYNTFTDASNYERGFVQWSSNVLQIGAEALGTGTLRNVQIPLSDNGNILIIGGSTSGTTFGVDEDGSLLVRRLNSSAFGLSMGSRGGSGPNTITLGAATRIAFSSVNQPDGDSTIDASLSRLGAGIIGVLDGASGGAALSFVEQTAPAAPGANGVYIYAVDNGSGKTQLMALFATGAAQQIAIEP